MYFDGRVEEINDYCRCDVLDTYFVFLRSRVLIGRLTADEEQDLVQMTHAMLQDQADENPAFRHYLEHWDARAATTSGQSSVRDAAGAWTDR